MFAGFPNRAVVDAYIKPEINESRSRFSWNEPDMEALREYLNDKIGWNREKFNSVVAPVLERFKSKEVPHFLCTRFKFFIITLLFFLFSVRLELIHTSQ